MTQTAAIHGIYFNGQTSRKLQVLIEVREGQLWVLDSDLQTLQSYSPQEFKVHAPLASSARVIEFSDGARFESFEYEKFEALFPADRHQGLIYKLENRISYAVGAALLGLMTLLFCHFYVIPWSAQGLARSTPQTVMNVLEKSTKQTLAFGWRVKLQTIDAQKYPQAVAVSQNLLQTYPALNLKIDMIQDGSIIKTPNAFALPGGQILVNQELLDLVSPEELQAILLHEVGHVYHRHSLQAMIKNAGLYAMLTLAFGVTDFGSLTLTLINAAYSRDDEREADDFSALALAQLKLNPLLLAQGLKKIEKASRRSFQQNIKKRTSKEQKIAQSQNTDDSPDTPKTPTDEAAAETTSPSEPSNSEPKKNASETANSFKLEGLLSTHPLTTERIDRLKKHAQDHGFPVEI